MHVVADSKCGMQTGHPRRVGPPTSAAKSRREEASLLFQVRCERRSRMRTIRGRSAVGFPLFWQHALVTQRASTVRCFFSFFGNTPSRVATLPRFDVTHIKTRLAKHPWKCSRASIHESLLINGNGIG